MKRSIALVLLFALLFSMPAMASSSQVEKVLAVAMKQLGAPYELLSDAPKSFNCVSFVMYCFNQVESGTISQDGIKGDYTKITSTKHLKPGDIVCFEGSSGQKGILGSHYGIYAGKGCFIHASNRDGMVTASKFKDYKKRFVGAIRIF